MKRTQQQFQKQISIINQTLKAAYEQRMIRNIKNDDNQQQKKQQKSLQQSILLNYLQNYPKDKPLNHFVQFFDLFKKQPHSKNKVNIKQIESILMTSFGFQQQVLLPLAKAGINLIIINDSPEQKNTVPYIKNYLGFPNWTIIIPKKIQTKSYKGVFHAKLWLIKFTSFLRVVISSGNLHIGDFLNWSNFYWYKDFKKQTCQNKDQKGEQFKQTIKSLLKNSIDNYKQQIIKIKFQEYNFQKINIQLIMSLPGKYNNKQLNNYGLCRFMKIINYDNKFIIKQPVITYCSTSLGLVDQKFCKQLFLYMGLADYKLGEYKVKGKFSQKIKLIYPTQEYIKKCKFYPDTLFLIKKNYMNNSFVKNIFHKYQGNKYYQYHQHIIPHLKVIIITQQSMEIQDSTIIYMGSHNMTRAAWGKLEKQGQQLTIKNTQLGLIFGPKLQSKQQKLQLIKKLPFNYPPQKYGKFDIPYTKF